jgi:hypothetical protein
MRATRILTTMCCAIAIAIVLMVSGARADEYNKLTYLTFSGPVQVPGVTLPAGTYMFKLADPDSGRRAIQIWDEKGTKLFTTLLTIPDEQPEAKDDPVVLFSERPSDSPNAVKSWFYPADRTGYEFIYPKDQAMKIAAAANAPVLAYNDELKSGADEAAMRGAQVGRVDAQGQAAAATSTANVASTTTTTSTAPAQAAAPPSTPASSTAASTAAADTASANRTPPSPAPSTTAPTTTAPATTAAADRTATRAVGTSGTQSAQNPQAARGAQDELPRTASPLATIQLMSIGLIASAFGVRQLRRRYAVNR